MIILDPEVRGRFLTDREGEAPWLLIGLGISEQIPASSEDTWQCTRAGSPAELAAHNIDLVAVISPPLRHMFQEFTPQILAGFLNEDPSTIIFLLPWQRPPVMNMRNDGHAHSFICSAQVFRSITSLHPEYPLDKLSFTALAAITNGEMEVHRVLVRQLPWREPQPAVVAPDGALIMAHRGKPVHLEMALRYLDKTAGMKLSVRVGLDVEDLSKYDRLVNLFPHVEFFSAQPAPVGPYVIRHELAKRSPEPIIVFHDSDDISCPDRLSTLYREMAASGCDLVGSHELKVDEINQTVTAFRFPLDVSDALDKDVGHPLQHPTSMVKRERFHDVGGFSTDQRVSNDSQFLLRAYFGMRIRNADEFVYIRRRHPEALTVAPETGMHIPLRRRLGASWNVDFRAVKNGTLRLEESSLRTIAGSGEYSFERLTGEGAVAAK
jgi:hypothetical protein